MYVCMYVCMHACMYVCMYVDIYIYMCVYIYIYIHIEHAKSPTPRMETLELWGWALGSLGLSGPGFRAEGFL